MNTPTDRSDLTRQALAANEARFRALVTATSDVIYSMSADWQVMQPLDGRGLIPDNNEPIADWQSKTIYPDDLQIVNDAINKAIEHKSTFELEHRVIRVDGTPGWIFSRAVPILDDKGEIIEWFGTASDITERKLIEDELRQIREQSEQQKRVYETITSGTPDLMYVFSLDYVFTYANSALLTMWGKSWDNAVGKGLRENGYEEWHALMHEREIDLVRATKQPVRGEVSFPHATLGKRVYDYILTPVFDQNGEVEAVAGTTRDVTERKMFEESLALSSEELQAINEEMTAVNEEQAASNEELTATNEELAFLNHKLLEAKQEIEESKIALRLAIDAANFGTWFIHSVTREFITDARLKELFGYYPDEPLSIEQAIAQITEEYRGYVANKLENAIYNNGDYDVTYPVIGLHDDKLRWLRAIGNLKADPSGAFSAFTGVVMDITEQYLAVKNVERAEESLRIATESGELGTWYYESDTGRFETSPRFNQIFGLPVKPQPAYQDIINHIREDHKLKVSEAVNNSQNSGTSFNVTYPLITPNNEERWVRSVGKMVVEENGPSYITGVLADITEQKIDEQRKNDFIGMVSHELKTPLTSLTAIIQVVNSKLRKNDDAFLAGAMDRANIQAKRMSTMINGFLNVSRLESGKISIDKQRFDMADLIHESEEETISMYSSHNIVFAPVEETIVNADRNKIGQVINNFISNAVKYSKPGSTINIACITINNNAVVSVKDQGIGIKQNEINRLFERYYRVEGNSHISGFGIGLYLSGEIIERHQGKIWVESEPGKGSTFYFSLPL